MLKLMQKVTTNICFARRTFGSNHNNQITAKLVGLEVQIITIKYVPFTISTKPNVKQQLLVYTNGFHLLGLTFIYTFAIC